MRTKKQFFALCLLLIPTVGLIGCGTGMRLHGVDVETQSGGDNEPPPTPTGQDQEIPLIPTASAGGGGTVLSTENLTVVFRATPVIARGDTETLKISDPYFEAAVKSLLEGKE